MLELLLQSVYFRPSFEPLLIGRYFRLPSQRNEKNIPTIYLLLRVVIKTSGEFRTFLQNSPLYVLFRADAY